LPNVGIVALDDAETGNSFFIDTSSFHLRRDYTKRARAIFSERSRLFRSISIDNIDIRTDIPYTKTLIEFFKIRERRKRH
jgi:hypothetical protein